MAASPLPPLAARACLTVRLDVDAIALTISLCCLAWMWADLGAQRDVACLSTAVSFAPSICNTSQIFLLLYTEATEPSARSRGGGRCARKAARGAV